MTFDAYHSSEDVPPLTIVNSDVKIDLGNALYATGICPSFQFSHGCVTPVGSALNHSHGSFYENSATHIAIEIQKGLQNTGLITLDCECDPMGN